MKTIHKVAAVVIEDNKFLMVRKHNKEMWTSLGGKVESGENEEEALLREIQEEFDCSATIIKKLGDFIDDAVFDTNTQLKLSVYLTELTSPINLIDPELAEYKFLDHNYYDEGVTLPPSIEDQVLPLCIAEGLLQW